MQSTGLWPCERRIFSCSVNTFSFHHQLTNELTGGTTAHYITHSIQSHNIIIMHAFLLMIEMRMCGHVIFSVADTHFLDSTSAASVALDLHSLLSYSFTIYYLTLEWQTLVVFASMRT
jgi:hypothetical protein